MRVESLEKWYEVSAKLSEKRYSLYTMQFDVNHPEGFHAWFLLHSTPGVEIVTHDQAVHDAILRYHP